MVEGVQFKLVPVVGDGGVGGSVSGTASGGDSSSTGTGKHIKETAGVLKGFVKPVMAMFLTGGGIGGLIGPALALALNPLTIAIGGIAVGMAGSKLVGMKPIGDLDFFDTQKKAVDIIWELLNLEKEEIDVKKTAKDVLEAIDAGMNNNNDIRIESTEILKFERQETERFIAIKKEEEAQIDKNRVAFERLNIVRGGGKLAGSVDLGLGSDILESKGEGAYLGNGWTIWSAPSN